MRRFRFFLVVLLLSAQALYHAQGGTPPVARNVVMTTQEGAAKTGTLLATDADGSALTFSVATAPAKGTLTIDDATTGAFTYTPSAGAAGYDAFTFRAADGTGSSTANGAVFIVANSPRWPGQTVRASVAPDGSEQISPNTIGASASADGRVIAFSNGSANEATGEFNLNVFVHDRQTGQTTFVLGGLFPVVSPDGRYVAFTTIGSILPGGDPTAESEAVLHDRQTGQTTRISVASDGTPANGASGFTFASADGRYVAFDSTATNLVPADTDDDEDVYLHDRATGQTTLLSVSSGGVKGNSNSWRATMSADGRYVAFNSEATNLVPGDNNNRVDVFVRDLWTGQTTRVATDTLGQISSDGRFVVFSSSAPGLVPNDTNGFADVFLREWQTGLTTRVSLSSSGAQGNGDSGKNDAATVSADGRYVAFRSTASNLVPDDTNGLTDEFVHDRVTGKTVRVNVASDGAQANAESVVDDDGCCVTPFISADGRSVVITSLASNLVPGDTNNTDDVFVVGPVNVAPATVNVLASGGTRSVDVSFDYPGTPWTATTAAPWITLNPPIGGSTNGTVAFTVAPNTGVARTGTIVAALQTVTVNQGPPTIPIAQNSAISTAEDTSISSTLIAGDADGDPVTFSLVAPPLHGAVVINDQASGAFTYLPTGNFNGADSFTFRASDGTTFSNTATVTITVTPVNDVPVATNGVLSTTANVFAMGSLSATDVDGDALTFSVVSPASHGTVTVVNALTGAYIYVPALNFSGADGFTFRAADAGVSSNVATVTINVAPAGPQAPATFRTIGDLPGGPLLSTVWDATKIDGVTYAVGGSAANNQTECDSPNNPPGCVTQLNTDTPVLWTWNGSAATLTPLPNLVTPATPPVNGAVASAITPDAAYIASQARSNASNPFEVRAVRVTRNGLANLNFSAPPFQQLNPPSAALSMSADGSIVYAISGNPPRAVRFDVNTSSRVFIPLLLGAHTGNVVIARGTSYDGSVAVGTSFVAPWTGTNGRAFRYVHGNPGTVSAIPLLAGGTWNWPLALSSDGRFTLVSGNSPSLPNGEVYLYDAVTGVTTPLGSPNTPWGPFSGGITADGSVVVATFNNQTEIDGSRQAYVHNAHGWFHLTTVLAAAGIDLAAGGWSTGRMQVNGISPDGTLVYGYARRESDDTREGFVAELPPGFLAAFDSPAVPPTDTSIVGAWGSIDDSVVFLADGTCFLIDTRHGTQPAGGNTSGFERCRYYWNAATGAFSIVTVQDTNGNVGLSGGNGFLHFNLTVSGDTLMLGDGIVLLRRVGSPGSIVGGWVFGDPRVDNNSGVVVFSGDGKYTFAEDGNSATDPFGRDGVEAGTYSWDPSGAFAVAVTLDANGEWGFGNGPGTGGTATLLLSPDGLRLGQPGDPNQLTRIVNPQAVLPVITSPLSATGIAGSPFTYTITATNASSFGATGLPNGLAINTTTGVISGTPSAPGTSTVTISASNSFNSTTTASLTITIVSPTGLTVQNASGSFGGTTTLAATLMSAGTPLAGQQVSFSLNGSPAGTATTNASGVATITGVSLAGIGAGTYPTGVQATYAGDATHAPSSGSATLTIAKAIPVVIWPTPANITHGTPLSAVQLNATASVPGTFVYAPPLGFILPIGAGQPLVATFTPTDSANYATVQAQVTITVVNAPPVARNVVVTTQEGITKSGTLVATDVENDPLTFSIITPPTKGTLTLVNASTGAFTYAPNAGAIGYDSFTFSAAENGGASSTATGAVFIVANSPRWPGQIVRASLVTTLAHSSEEALSADGRFIAFTTIAGTLVPGDTNGSIDVFVFDRQTGLTSRVSLASNGTQSNHHSYEPVLSADGRFVAFHSYASNLVAGDTNDWWDVFVHDRQTGQTSRVSVGSDGAQGNNYSEHPAISADGRFVAFRSAASNLVASDTNGFEDVFVHDRQTGQTTRVSVASDGTQANSGSTQAVLSADGRFVAFTSFASNLVAGDTNNWSDVFVHDRQTGQTTRVSLSNGGAQGNSVSDSPALSADGRFVAFKSFDSSLVAGDTNATPDVFVRDRQTGQTTRVSVASNGAQGLGHSERPALSADGRFVAFVSNAWNLVADDSNAYFDVFVHDRQTGETRRVSLGSNGAQGDADIHGAAISGDGRFIAFSSEAGTLGAGDTNPFADVFVVGGVSVGQTAVNVSGAGGTRSVNVSFDYPGTSWTATTTTPWIAITPPGGGSTSGTVAFTVAPNTGAARTGTIVVALQTVTVNQDANTAPLAQNGSITTPEDTPISGTLVATDPDGHPITFSVVTQPTRGTVALTNASTGAFTYTPALNQFGADSFTFRASDGGLTSNIATVTISVTGISDAPVVSNVVVTTQEGVTKSGTLLATDAENDALTFSIITPPTKGTLTLVNPSTGAFTYAPNVGAIGYDSFTFQAAEGSGASSTATGAVFIVASSPRWPGQTVRVNVGSDGTQADGPSTLGAVPSADGRFIAFASAATNLAPGIPAGSYNVFVRDRLTGQTTLASVMSGGGQAIGGALPWLTPDGRYVAFTTLASGQLGSHPDASYDAYVHDRQTGQTTRINVATNGTPGNGENVLPVTSADGRYVAFYGTATNLVAADTTNDEDVYLHDRLTGQTTLLSLNNAGVKGNSGSWRPTISADGRYVAFQSEASNLVPNDTNGAIDVFVRDLWTGQTTRASVATGGGQGNSSSQGVLSPDGRYVVFASTASSLVAGDTNSRGDVFVRDLQTGQTTRVSLSSTGVQGNGSSEDATISADGRYVAFRSIATNLVPGDTNGTWDEFVHDRLTGQTVRINVASDGTQANAASLGDEDGCCLTPFISADGRSIAIMTIASNLVSGDTNGADDVFVVGPVLVSPTTVNVSGSAGTHSVNVSVDYQGPWTATTTTPWITLDPPVGGSASGSVSFTVAANPGAARTGTIVVALQTVTVNQAASTVPVAQNATITTAEDTPFSGTLVASDPNGDALTFSIVTQPTRGTVVLTNPSTGTFTYTPALNQFGGDSFTFQASAGGETSNIATVSITVTPVNDAPVATDGTLGAIEDTVATGALSATDVDGGTLTFSVVTQPAHGAVAITNATTGAYSYTPAANYNGPDSFTFRASDGNLNSNIATVTISVAAVADAPVVSSVVVTTQEGVAKIGTLLATDADNDPVTFSVVTPPTKGSLAITNPTTGAFTYTPNAGAIGYDTFAFSAADSGGASSTATGIAFIVAASPRWPGQTVRASVASDGAQGNGASLEPTLSADGRYVAFYSNASNLVAGDTNATTDVFVYDRQTGQTTRVSVASDGGQGNNGSFRPALSADGRYVAFLSGASNLVAGDTNGQGDVFVHDRQTGQTTRVSVASDGTQSNNSSVGPTLSADGRYVAFYSYGSTLVAGDTNGTTDVFVHDRQTGQTTRVSVASDGAQGNNNSYETALSADGRYVAFYSHASNLVPGDTNAVPDVFVHDRQTGQTTRVSLASDGAQGNGHSYDAALSADGRYVAFLSLASNLVAGDNNGTTDAFVHDRQTGQTTRVSVANNGFAGNDSFGPSLSADGRYVAFLSSASNLVAGDTNGTSDAFVHDRQTGQTTRVSVASDGAQGNSASDWPALSADGRYIAFHSNASNLVPSDTNAVSDAFVIGSVAVSPTTVSVPGSAGTHTVNVSVDYPGPWTASTSTPWITLNPPVGGSVSGVVSFAVAANPGAARTGSIVVALQTVTVNQGPSTAPVAQPVTITTLEDTAFSGTLVATDPNGDALTFNIVTQPVRGTVVITNPSTGAFTYTPLPNRFGGDTFTFQASAAGETSNIATVTIDITPVNDAPMAFDSTLDVTEDTPASSFFSTADGDSLLTTVELVTPPAHGTVTIPNPSGSALGGVSYTYTPSPNYNGPDSFTFRAVEAGLSSNTATVTITVLPANDAPVANNIVATAQEGVVTSLSMTATDIDGDALTFSIVTPPTKGAATITNAATGAFTLTPNAGAFGYDTFTFRAVDGSGASSSATVMVFVVTSSPRWPGGLVRASVASNGAQGNDFSSSFATSADGRYIAFDSNASNLVAGDTNGFSDVFVRDRNTGVVTRVSVGNGGAQANSNSGSPALSADGRYVAFISNASNLVAGDSNGMDDFFVRDLQSGQTSRVAPLADPTATSWIGVTPALSADGRYVAFVSVASNLVAGDTNGLYDVFVHDRQTGQTTRVNVASNGTSANQSSFDVRLSADGHYAAFTTAASNLVAGDTNGQDDVFVHDRHSGQTIRASLSTGGTQASGFSRGPAISADGRFVAFYSSASNLVTGDTNAVSDVFVRDLQTGQTTRMSVASDGTQANQSSTSLAMSADGRFVVFESTAPNLVAGDTNGQRDLFVRDRQTGLTSRASVASDGGQPAFGANNTVMSADGRFIGFSSFASNLVPSDTNGVTDVFVLGGVSVSPTTLNVPAAGGSPSVTVAFVYPGTPWAAATTTPWITINPPNGGSTNGTLSFTVAPNIGAARTGTLVVAGQTVTVTQDAATLPVAQDGAISTPEDTMVAGTLIATDPNGDAISLSIVTQPAHGTLVLTNPSTGAFTYTPAPDFFGSDSFTFQATAGGDTSNISTVSVTVTPTNDVPVATNGTLTATEDIAATGTLTAIDVDGDLLTFSVVSQPAHGVVTITNAATGAYKYTPALNFNGTDSFTFRASDLSSTSNIANVVVSVAAVEDAPQAASVLLATPENTGVTGALAATDPEGDAFTFSILTTPAKGVATLTDPVTGAFTYTPNAGVVGYDTFTFQASNAAGTSVGTATIVIVAGTPRWPGQTVRVSIPTTGPYANAASYQPALSADGRYVAFYTLQQLVPSDTDGVFDVYVYDRQTGQATRASVASNGGAPDNSSDDMPSLSANGRLIAFSSMASNLVPGDTNGQRDIFVRDLQTGQTTRVSAAPDGSPANGNSYAARLSPDGRHVTFSSNASNLVVGDSNDRYDIFVRDLQSGGTTRVSIGSDGAQGNADSYGSAMSGDGRYVAFQSDASTLVAGDANGTTDAFIHDRQTGQTTRVSLSSLGAEGNGQSYAPVLSANGQYVAFVSYASNLVPADTNAQADVFVRDRQTGQTTRVSVAHNTGAEGNGLVVALPTMSLDGRYVAFVSRASNLVADDTNNHEDVFVHDRHTAETRRVSVASNGVQGNEDGSIAAISGDGRFVAFSSMATSLVPGDTNGQADIFIVGGVSLSRTFVVAGPAGGPNTVDVAFDYPGTPWTATTTTPWITINPPSGASANGAVSFTVAPNLLGVSRTGSVVAALQTITVFQDLATAPQAQNSSIAVPEDLGGAGALTAIDPNGDAVTFMLVTQPAHGSVVLTNPFTGAFTYTPTLNFNGADSFTFQVADGTELSNIATMSVTVTPTHDAPIATNGTLAAAEDTPTIGTLVATDIDGDTLTFSVVAQPSHGVVTITNPTTGAYTYTGLTNYNGADSFTFRASDASATSNIASVIVGISPVNDAPLALNVVVATQAGVASSGVLSAIDVEGDAATFSLVTPPTNGSLVITNTATGAFTYTPNAGTVGFDTFTFRAADGFGASSTATGGAIVVAARPNWPGQLVRASVASNGAQGDSDSGLPVLSADGRFVAFESRSSNLVANDTNGATDIFVRDRKSGQTSRVSVASNGTQSNNHSLSPSISADGRYVAFYSDASNLVSGDTNLASDVFVHDRQTGETTRISLVSSGAQGNNSSFRPVLSADGRTVAFTSYASNLAAGDTNATQDVFVHDRYTGATTIVSMGIGAAPGDGHSHAGSLSIDGRYVAFVSTSSNLVAGDTNGTYDVFVHDRQTAQTTRVSVASDGTQADESSDLPDLSADGRYVSFSSRASNLVAYDTNGQSDAFVHDRVTGQTTRVSGSGIGISAQANAGSYSPALSADGRFVAFFSDASNLVPGDTNSNSDVFVHDRQSGTTTLVSRANNGGQGATFPSSYSSSSIASLSADGRYIAFMSAASDLVVSDTNSSTDAFVAGGVSVSPTAINTPSTGGTSSVSVAFEYPGTPWIATTTAPWITIAPPGGASSNGSVSLTVASNPGAIRVGTVVVALQSITIVQGGTPDVTPPIVTPPSSLTTYATMPGGATRLTLPPLAQWLSSATATDDVTSPPIALAATLNGAPITDATVFALGANTVTFSFRDAAGNVGTATSVVTVLGGLPAISMAVAGQTTPAPGQRAITLKVTNSGTGNAMNLNLALSGLRTLTGTGTATLISGLPASIPLLRPGQSLNVRVVVNLPSSVLRFLMTEALTMTDYTGASVSTTASQTIFADINPPTVTVGPSATVTSTSMTITWSTNEGATSRVDWGVGTSTNRFVPEDSVYKTSHTVTLTGLLPNTTYSFIVSGKDVAGNGYMSSRRQVRTNP